MFVRLALEEDVDAIIAMSKINAQTRPTLKFNEARARATFQSYIDNASPTFWVCEENREVIGFFVGEFRAHYAFDGLFTVQDVLFVRPERRGSRAAVLLMKNFIAWSKRLGANEIIGGNDNEFNSDRTAQFLEHFGFERVGFAMRLALDG
jgi:L-amino acid N-acyltransferase YncA